MHSVELGSLRPAKIKEALISEQIRIRGFHHVISKTEIPGTRISWGNLPDVKVSVLNFATIL